MGAPKLPKPNMDMNAAAQPQASQAEKDPAERGDKITMPEK